MDSPSPPFALDEHSLAAGVGYLTRRDPDLAEIHARLGLPPLWKRPAGFAALVFLILEQQVSLASARAAYNRLAAACGEITPLRFLALDDTTLRAIGFSRQKMGYCRGLAEVVHQGKLDLESLAKLPDDDVRRSLTAFKGIGPWTAENYLLLSLLRPDAWPASDLALQVAVQQVKGLPDRPTPAQVDALGEPWHPWRGVAARMLWFHYLNGQEI
jgi:DNA-3-methyladenine glycosylase II